MKELYAEAGGSLSGFRSTSEARVAVQELGGYSGETATNLLLEIAQGRTQFTWPDTQREAMRSLSTRTHVHPTVGIALAGLLQPHLSLTVRKAAADALLKLPCQDDCISGVLHYIERMWEGEQNYEDHVRNPPALDFIVRSERSREQQDLRTSLDAVLAGHPQSTVRVLKTVYGLGTAVPSEFALALLDRVRLHDACAPILGSERELLQTSAASFVAPRDKLAKLAHSLDCH
jgi:hypothetical protein